MTKLHLYLAPSQRKCDFTRMALQLIFSASRKGAQVQNRGTLVELFLWHAYQLLMLIWGGYKVFLKMFRMLSPFISRLLI